MNKIICLCCNLSVQEVDPTSQLCKICRKSNEVLHFFEEIFAQCNQTTEQVIVGPNSGQYFPSILHVENFNYNGFYCISKKGFSEWTITNFIKWTDDPGIGLFHCSDGKNRLIPDCQLTGIYKVTLPSQPKMKSSRDIRSFFGTPSHS